MTPPPPVEARDINPHRQGTARTERHQPGHSRLFSVRDYRIGQPAGRDLHIPVPTRTAGELRILGSLDASR